jgi:hypothetical protein
MSEVMMTGGDENTSREEGVSGGAESTAARIGIDEDTAMVMRGHECFDVLGSGAVYIVDGKAVTYSPHADDESHLSSVFGICLHVLTEGDTFDVHGRVPNPRNRDRLDNRPSISGRKSVKLELRESLNADTGHLCCRGKRRRCGSVAAACFGIARWL